MCRSRGVISHPAVTRAARRPGELCLPLTVVPQKSRFCLFHWVGNVSCRSPIPGKAVCGKCCFSLVALPCHGHQSCPLHHSSWCQCSSPANCRQKSPIHPIQLPELCISGVSIFLIHHQLCVHTEDKYGCPQLSSLLASRCHHLVLSKECSKKIFLCLLWLNLGTASLLQLQNCFCRGDFVFSSLCKCAHLGV